MTIYCKITFAQSTLCAIQDKKMVKWRSRGMGAGRGDQGSIQSERVTFLRCCLWWCLCLFCFKLCYCTLYSQQWIIVIVHVHFLCKTMTSTIMRGASTLASTSMLSHCRIHSVTLQKLCQENFLSRISTYKFVHHTGSCGLSASLWVVCLFLHKIHDTHRE